MFVWGLNIINDKMFYEIKVSNTNTLSVVAMYLFLVFNADLNYRSDTVGMWGEKNCEKNDDYVDFSVKFWYD